MIQTIPAEKMNISNLTKTSSGGYIQDKNKLFFFCVNEYLKTEKSIEKKILLFITFFISLLQPPDESFNVFFDELIGTVIVPRQDIFFR